MVGFSQIVSDGVADVDVADVGGDLASEFPTAAVMEIGTVAGLVR